MTEKRNTGQSAHAFDSWTTQYLKEALQEGVPEPAVEALVAESMTLKYVQANLNSASVAPVKAQPHGTIERNSSKK